jgi:iron complex transport system ATP-binding protein
MANHHITLEGIGLSLGYSQQGKRKELLHDLAFQLYSGELTCLLGPNGVGKSTLIKAILGDLKPWEGKLLLDQQELSSYGIEERAKRIAVVLTEPSYPGNLTVGQLVALGRTPHMGWAGKLGAEDRKWVDQALSDTRLTALQDERLGELSDGQRQKAMIARALAQDGKVLVLDEPTAHLDLINRLEIMTLLREISQKKEKAVLVVTHDLDIALETADRFWLMNCGSPLHMGRPEDILLSGKIQDLFPGEKYRFELERGKVELVQDPDNLSIEGPAAGVYWVKKALQKAGVRELPEPIVIEPDFRLTYREKTFTSIEELFQAIQDGKN